MERATVKTYIDQCNALDLSGAADCIESLAAEIERLRPLADEVQAARHVMREHNRLLVELSASQYRERQLRSVLQRIAEPLEAIVDRAGEVMRERCLFEADIAYHSRHCCNEIRALPGVTLDDIK